MVCLLIGKTGLYIKEVLFLHLHCNFESKSVIKCRSYVHASDVITNNYFADDIFGTSRPRTGTKKSLLNFS